jgi:hypothetical protein
MSFPEEAEDEDAEEAGHPLHPPPADASSSSSSSSSLSPWLAPSFCFDGVFGTWAIVNRGPASPPPRAGDSEVPITLFLQHSASNPSIGGEDLECIIDAAWPRLDDDDDDEEEEGYGVLNPLPIAAFTHEPAQRALSSHTALLSSFSSS